MSPAFGALPIDRARCRDPWFVLLVATVAVLIVSACAEPGAPPTTASNMPSDIPQQSNGPLGDMTVVIVSGILDPAGNEVTTLQPPKRLVVPRGPLPSPTEGRYVLEVIYETGDRLDIPFNALVADDAGNTQHGFFEIVVPADQAIQTMTILDIRTARNLATLHGADIVK